MVYVKSKYTGQCYVIWDSSALEYGGWIFISKEEYKEYIKRLGL